MTKVGLTLIIAIFVSLSKPGDAQAEPGFFIGPNAGFGYNTVQGGYLRIGLDVGVIIDENWYGGVGGFYSSGDHPGDDRELGGGPFLGYNYPVTSFLVLQTREDIDYADVRNPVLLDSGDYTYTAATGIESATYAGVHFRFTRNFGLSIGYRAVIGLTNNAIASGRSSTVLGITVGI